MSLSSFFYEPFYSLADFDRLFDEAFSARTDGNANNRQVARQGQSSNGAGPRALRPR